MSKSEYIREQMANWKPWYTGEITNEELTRRAEAIDRKYQVDLPLLKKQTGGK